MEKQVSTSSYYGRARSNVAPGDHNFQRFATSSNIREIHPLVSDKNSINGKIRIDPIHHLRRIQSVPLNATPPPPEIARGIKEHRASNTEEPSNLLPPSLVHEDGLRIGNAFVDASTPLETVLCHVRDLRASAFNPIETKAFNVMHGTDQTTYKQKKTSVRKFFAFVESLPSVNDTIRAYTDYLKKLNDRADWESLLMVNGGLATEDASAPGKPKVNGGLYPLLLKSGLGGSTAAQVSRNLARKAVRRLQGRWSPNAICVELNQVGVSVGQKIGLQGVQESLGIIMRNEATGLTAVAHMDVATSPDLQGMVSSLRHPSSAISRPSNAHAKVPPLLSVRLIGARVGYLPDDKTVDEDHGSTVSARRVVERALNFLATQANVELISADVFGRRERHALAFSVDPATGAVTRECPGLISPNWHVALTRAWNGGYGADVQQPLRRLTRGPISTRINSAALQHCPVLFNQRTNERIQEMLGMGEEALYERFLPLAGPYKAPAVVGMYMQVIKDYDDELGLAMRAFEARMDAIAIVPGSKEWQKLRNSFQHLLSQAPVLLGVGARLGNKYVLREPRFIAAIERSPDLLIEDDVPQTISGRLDEEMRSVSLNIGFVRGLLKTVMVHAISVQAQVERERATEEEFNDLLVHTDDGVLVACPTWRQVRRYDWKKNLAGSGVRQLGDEGSEPDALESGRCTIC